MYLYDKVYGGVSICIKSAPQVSTEVQVLVTDSPVVKVPEVFVIQYSESKFGGSHTPPVGSVGYKVV